MSDEASDAATDLRAAVRAFCAEHDPAATPRAAFLSARFDAGLAAVHYPVGHGGLGLPRGLQSVAEEEFARAGAPRPDNGRNVIGLGMAAPTIIAFGTRRAAVALAEAAVARRRDLVPAVQRAGRGQ